MIADVILGITIDTKILIADLKSQEFENLYVVDYSYFGEPMEINGVTYLSALKAKRYLEKYDSIIFYKNLYAYPGMNGKMSSLL